MVCGDCREPLLLLLLFLHEPSTLRLLYGVEKIKESGRLVDFLHRFIKNPSVGCTFLVEEVRKFACALAGTRGGCAAVVDTQFHRRRPLIPFLFSSAIAAVPSLLCFQHRTKPKRELCRCFSLASAGLEESLPSTHRRYSTWRFTALEISGPVTMVIVVMVAVVNLLF